MLNNVLKNANGYRSKHTYKMPVYCIKGLQEYRYSLPMLKIIYPLLLLFSFELFAEPLILAPQANDDYASVIVGISPSVSVNLSANDRYGSIVTIDGSTTGQYGFVQLFDKIATYTLYDNSANATLAAGQIVIDTFTYTYANDIGQTASAHLIVQVSGNRQTPVAVDDYVTVMPNNIDSATGNVSTNDKNGTIFYLNSSPSSEYGFLILNADGSFTYTLYNNAPSISKLVAGEVVTDSFSYTSADQYGQSAIANLNVSIIGNPVDSNGNTVFENEAYENVDVEFNDRSANATPLNSSRNIKGHLYNPGDKDWYSLYSGGNEIIKLEACPAGSSCFGKKSWVLYVFDKDKLTPEMEEKTYTFRSWVDETGTNKDLLGNIIMSDFAGASNHLYLAYEQGFFDGALIGIVDPCFDTSNSVEIGVGDGARNYLIAISSPLMGSDDAGKPAGECGVGSVVLRKPGLPVSGLDAEEKAKTYETTEEYITVFPYSDDQYTINITGTGLNPLLSTTAGAKSAKFNANTGELNIPKVRVLDKLYEARLIRQNQFANNVYNFALSGLRDLGPEENADAFQATYNPANQQVLIPRVTDTASGNAYSVIMQYHPGANGNAEWLEAIAITLIQ